MVMVNLAILVRKRAMILLVDIASMTRTLAVFVLKVQKLLCISLSSPSNVHNVTTR